MSDRKSFAPNLSFFFSIFMLVIYSGLAVVLLTTKWPANLPYTNRIILVIAIIVYVFYRAYRLSKRKTG